MEQLSNKDFIMEQPSNLFTNAVAHFSVLKLWVAFYCGIILDPFTNVAVAFRYGIALQPFTDVRVEFWYGTTLEPLTDVSVAFTVEQPSNHFLVLCAKLYMFTMQQPSTSSKLVPWWLMV